MKMQRREKILAYTVVALLVAAAGYLVIFSGDGRTATQLNDDREKLTSELQGKEKQLRDAAADEKRLAEWRRRALPADRTVAQSAYQNWLRTLADKAHFRQLTFAAKEPESRAGAYTRMPFTVSGRATLADVTQFLHDFYSAGHLQQIRRLNLKPADPSGDLDVNLTIEALSMPDADRKDQLTKEKGRGLRFAKLDKYREPIVKRNLFAAYAPPSPVTPRVADKKKPDKPKETVDKAEFTFVTGFTEVNGLGLVWIQDRMAGKTWQLAEGGKFKVGELNGTVRKITPRDVTLDFDGHRRQLRDGDNLRGGIKVDGYSKN